MRSRAYSLGVAASGTKLWTRGNVRSSSSLGVPPHHAAFIWSVADLRGDYKQSEYGKVILPMVVLRRLDCGLELTKAAVLERQESLKGRGIDNVPTVLEAVSGEQFYNVSRLDLSKLLDDSCTVAAN